MKPELEVELLRYTLAALGGFLLFVWRWGRKTYGAVVIIPSTVEKLEHLVGLIFERERELTQATRRLANQVRKHCPVERDEMIVLENTLSYLRDTSKDNRERRARRLSGEPCPEIPDLDVDTALEA